MATSTHFVKNRRFIRVDYPSLLEFCLASEAAKSYEAFTLNISAGGMCLHLDQEVSAGQWIEIKKSLLPVSCNTARVCWVKKTPAGNYVAGCEFLF
jgi:c-di-GMP-binding flagellar brake protein YcgR